MGSSITSGAKAERAEFERARGEQHSLELYYDVDGAGNITSEVIGVYVIESSVPHMIRDINHYTSSNGRIPKWFDHFELTLRERGYKLKLHPVRYSKIHMEGTVNVRGSDRSFKTKIHCSL